MAWVPKRFQKKEVPEIVPKDRTHFIGNATGTSDVAENTGVRYAPRSANAKPTRRTLKNVRQEPTKKSAKVGFRLRNLAPKFQTMIFNHMRLSKKNRKLAKKLNKINFTKRNLKKLEKRLNKKKNT